MPREYVYTNYVSGQEAPQFLVSVGWSKFDDGGHVQVATIRNGMEHSVDEGGIYTDLDRTSINDLIRLLRRARDQAFGRDE